MTGLESYRVQGLPAQSVFYVPDFVSEQEEVNLVECVERAPRTKWVHLANRSLQQFGGEPRPNGMLVETMPHVSFILTLSLFECLSLPIV